MLAGWVIGISAWILLAMPVGAQDRRGGPDAASTLQQARAYAGRGQFAEALARLDTVIMSGRSGVAAEDLAFLQLTAADIAVKVGDLPRARAYLVAAQEIVATKIEGTDPLLAAQLLRRIGNVWQHAGDLHKADAVLNAALPAFLARDAAWASGVLHELGTIHLELLQLPAAISDLERSLEQLARAQSDPLAAVTGPVASRILADLATAYGEQSDTESAHAAAERARVAAGGDARLLAAADLAEAQAAMRELNSDAADVLLQRAAAAAPLGDPLRGHALLSLARFDFDRGRMSEAAAAATQAIDAFRAAHEERQPAYARAQHTLGTALSTMGNEDAARAALESAARVWLDVLGETSLPYQMTRLELGWLFLRIGDDMAAERNAQGALDAFQAVPPPDKRPEGLALILLGLVAEERGQVDHAVALFHRGQSLIEWARGPLSPDLGFSLVRLGRLLTRAGRYVEAAPPLERAIAIYENVGGADTIRLSEAMTARAELDLRAGNRQQAVEDATQAAQVLRDSLDVTGGENAIGIDGLQRSVRGLLLSQVRVILDAAPYDQSSLERAFVIAQDADAGRAGEALRQTANRFMAQGDELAVLLKQRAAAVNTVRATGRSILTSATQSNNVGAAQDHRQRREQAMAALKNLNTEIAGRYPRFANYLEGSSTSVGEVQAELQSDEVLLAPQASDDGLLVWVIAAHAARPVRVPLTGADITDLVRRIRDGVDLDKVGGELSALKPFDTRAARMLHDAIIGSAEATGLMTGVSHLIFVPDRTLQSLPPHLLRDKERRWLAERYVITISPSVSAAVAARRAGRNSSRAPMAFLGIGDALPIRSTARGEFSELWQRLARLDELIDSRRELAEVAAAYGDANSLLLVGADATLQRITAVHPQRFRIIDFATHALMAGDFPNLAEPSLVLSSDQSAGLPLLGMSDVATLELDADLVILSGCNTAGPDAGSQDEGLSGLAQAFFYAGARSLLVSHWSVASDATARVMAGVALADTGNGGTRRWADALTEAMRTMIRDPKLQHPLYWAPFVAVGG